MSRVPIGRLAEVTPAVFYLPERSDINGNIDTQPDVFNTSMKHLVLHTKHELFLWLYPANEEVVRMHVLTRRRY
jgi:hypothetical protein